MAKGKNVTVALKGASVSVDQGRINAQAFRPLPDKYAVYHQVGLIAAEGARIEHMLDQSIAYVAGLDLRIGACFTGQMIGPAPRFSTLLHLCIERGLSTDALKRIKVVSGHAAPYFERRNRAVHDPWYEDAGAGTTHQFIGKPKAKTDFGVKPKTEAQLKEDLTELRKYREEVRELVSAIWSAMQPA